MPKKHPKEQVEETANSIKRFGWKQPLVIDKDGVIVVGHCRFLAAKKLGKKVAPCILADDLTDEEVKAYRLVDNKTNESDWDLDLLDLELRELDALDFDMDRFGFDLSFGDDPQATEAVDDGYDPGQDVEPKTKPGEIYQLGDHRLIVGDATNPDTIKNLMGGAVADMLLTDPPYNVDYQGGTGMKIQNDNMSDGDFLRFLGRLFRVADGVLKPGGAFYIWHADSEGYNFRKACFDTGWKVRQCLIWKKNSLVLGRQDYQWIHEPCIYGWKDGAAHTWEGDRKQTTVLCFDRPARSDLHPTMKPVPLFAYQIQNSSRPGEVVLDVCGGSGTSVIACEQMGRRCHTCEIDPRYADKIIDRWESYTGKKAVVCNG